MGLNKQITKLAFDLKTTFYVSNSTANQYFERSWTTVKWYGQLIRITLSEMYPKLFTIFI